MIKFRIFVSLFLSLATVISTANAVPFRTPTKQQLQADIEAFAKTYICPNNQISLMEAATQKIDCPAGRQLLPMVYNNLKTGEWNKKDVLAMATGEYDLFQPNIENLIDIGAQTSNVVVIEYTDPQCPFCIHFLQKQFKPIREKYVDSGKVQYKIHHTPLPFHQDAALATEANLCAADQGAYKPFHQLLMTDMNKQKRADLLEYAQTLDLDKNQFTACLDTHKHTEQVKFEKSLLDKVMPITFPFFIVGEYENDKFVAHTLYGAPFFHILDTNKLSQIIDKELAGG